MNDFSDLVPQALIEFSINRAVLRLTPELEREVAAAATEVGASPEAVALALWLGGSQGLLCPSYVSVHGSSTIRFGTLNMNNNRGVPVSRGIWN